MTYLSEVDTYVSDGTAPGFDPAQPKGFDTTQPKGFDAAQPKGLLRTLSVTFPYLPPKEYSNNWRGHWSKRRGGLSVKARILRDLELELERLGWVGPVFSRAEIGVTFIFPDRRKRDHDSFVTRMKPFWDVLVALAVIKDDCLDVIGWPHYQHEYSKRNSSTLIKIMGN